MDSLLRRSSESDTTGYSTDYSTFEVVSQQTRSSSSCRNSLPDRGLRVDVSPRRAKPSVNCSRREECQELLGASAAGRVQNSYMANVGGDDDAIEREDENDEDVMRDDSHCCPAIINCSLIPTCVFHRWKACRLCYLICIGILMIAMAFTTGIGVFWGVEIFKYRSHMSMTVDLATSGAYNVTSAFPLSNIYGDEVCLSFEQIIPHFDVVELSYVSLISKSCSDLTVTTRNESLYRDSPLQYSSYMFHWLSGTIVNIHAMVNSTSGSVVTIFLLNDAISENYCSMHMQPNNIVKKWMFDFSSCNLNYVGGYMDCYMQATINSSATFYICINSTIDVLLSYEFFISSVVYNTSATKAILECNMDEDCCLSFDNLLSEAVHPTCMYISTEALSPDYLGMKLVDVNIQVGQRLSVIKYCFIILLVLLFLLGVIVIFFLLSRYKVNHPNFDPQGCTVHCSMYGRNEKHIY